MHKLDNRLRKFTAVEKEDEGDDQFDRKELSPEEMDTVGDVRKSSFD